MTKKKTILAAVMAGTLVLLLVANAAIKNKNKNRDLPGESKERVLLTEEDVRKNSEQMKGDWETYSRKNDILQTGETNQDTDSSYAEMYKARSEKKRARLTEENEEVRALFTEEDLSIYPAPSYVSEQEDTVIYKKGIYKRVGFVEEDHSQDTIVVNNKTYVRLR